MSSDPVVQNPTPRVKLPDVADDGDGGDAAGDGTLPYDADDPLGKAIWMVGEKKKDATAAVNANTGKTDDPMANLKTLQAQLKLTEAVNFAVNLMMTIHQQCMAAINKLGEAGR